MNTKTEEPESLVIGTAQLLQERVAMLARARGADRADIGGLLATQAFEDFETRSREESPGGLLSGYETVLSTYEATNRSMWPVRVSRQTAIRLKLTAREYELSVSQLVSGLIAARLARQDAVG